MGRYKFRLSDMIPRAWLRKLNHPGSALSNPRSLLPHNDDDRLRHDHDRLPPTPPPPLSPLNQAHQRKSYHFSRQFDKLHPCGPPSPPKRSTTSKHRRSAHLRRPTRRSTPRRVTASVSAGCSCRTLANFDPVSVKPECRFPISPPSSLSSTDAIYPQSTPSFGRSSGSVPSSELFDQMVSWTTTSSSCRCRTDLDDSVMLDDGFDCDPLFELELPEVITKPLEFNEMVMNLRKRGENKKPFATDHHKDSSSSLNSSSAVLAKVVEEETYKRTVRADKEQKKPRPPICNSASSPAGGMPAGGMRLRVNSPKLASRKLNRGHLQGRKSMNLSSPTRKSGISNGFAVVKSSVDPWKDFRESMVEMIVEKDIRESKDLEELLACYLMLNSDEYHDLIVRVFKQIWFDFYDARLK